MTLLNPVDDKRVLTLAKLATTAEARGLDILLLGAFARDLLFWYTHGIECSRETMDVDLVVQLKSWDAYHEFRAALLCAGFIGEGKAHPEKLRDTSTGVEVDLLPFGEIAEDGQTVVWPEDNSRWSVVGIQDAYDHALRFEIPDGKAIHIIRFISLPALVFLKIVAVHDRPEARFKKDTMDIGFVIRNYLQVGNKDRLMSYPHEDIYKDIGSDLDRATARLLGRDMNAMMSVNTKKYVIDLLEKDVASKSPCRFMQGLQRSLCNGDFPRSRIIVREILSGLFWHPPDGT